MSDTYDIFLSYAHEDSNWVRPLVEQLESAGVRCFVAGISIGAGELWEEKIRQALQEVERVVLFITPNSQKSLWVAAEAGAAWALEKPLIAATMFVETSDLIEPIRRHQMWPIDGPERFTALVNALSPSRKFPTDRIDGQWIDPNDNDTVFFKQRGTRVVGFYDYGSGKDIVGVYRGSFVKRVLEYRWNWLNWQFKGTGIMTLSTDGKTLNGKWWYAGREDKKPETLQYHRVSDAMPSWLSPEIFDEYESDFKEL
ncbi:MAG: toll/interleukin-1 receptor domain-containing protein [Acidobacteriota bacterium]|nr:toll/interleukin-1 receptor domain-containing protein [Acidobacteriota bacterium]